ncbi:MAG TPA: hypothetical protein PKB03_04410, partial [Baekduia sp.]|nr:hypothetical protein [Baekduia sp.]
REQVLEARERSLGVEPPQTVSARSNLANSLAAVSRADGMVPMAVASDFEADDRSMIPDWSLHWVRSVRNLWEYEGEVHGVVPRGRSPRGPSSAIVRRVTYLDPRNVVEVDGLRCTDVSLTLIHLARRLRETKLRLVCERAEYERKLDVEALAATLARMPPPPGVRALRKVLADTSLETALLDSSLERRMLRLLRGAGVSAGVPQHWFVLPSIGRVRADLWFEDSMLVVEVDGPHHRLPMQ